MKIESTLFPWPLFSLFASLLIIRVISVIYTRIYTNINYHCRDFSWRMSFGDAH